MNSKRHLSIGTALDPSLFSLGIVSPGGITKEPQAGVRRLDNGFRLLCYALGLVG